MGGATHRGTLCYSFDFKLAVGTPVLAARGGTIAAVVDHFRGGGAKAHLAPRANFVAVRHSDGSYARYYHLKEKGSLYKVGERVGRGQQIAWSGNTGYTGGPHLHFDLVNLLPEETSTLRIVSPKHCRKRLQSVAAAFSCELPSVPLRCKVVHVPNDAVNGGGLTDRKAVDRFIGQRPGVDVLRENIIFGRAGRVCRDYFQQQIRSRALCHGWMRDRVTGTCLFDFKRSTASCSNPISRRGML